MDRCSQMLSRLVVAMLDDTSLQSTLERAAREAVDLLQVDGAAVVLFPGVGTSKYLAASDAAALDLEHLQSRLDQGPGLLAHESMARVSVPELALDVKFPELAAAADEVGLSGVFAFPLCRDGVSLGALDLYRKTPGTLADDETLAAQTLADLLTAYVISAQTRMDLEASSTVAQETVAQLRTLDDERNDFVATIIHELGSPVASIAGFTELLEETHDLSDQQRGFVSAIHRSSDSLRALTEDLLTLFSLEPVTTKQAHVEVDLRAVVAAVRVMLVSGSTAPALDVSFHLPESPVRILGDPRHLERMLSNLMSNAVKYTPPGGAVACVLGRQDGHATLEVRDTGIGIPEAEQSELFTKFFRGSTAKASAAQGTGLGLAIVKSVVLGHGGTIAVSSARGSGTRFVVRMPVVGA